MEFNAQYKKSIEEMKQRRQSLQHWTDQFSDKNKAEIKKMVIDLERHKTALASKGIAVSHSL